MKFGTSGWRGLLLEDFTTRNVACVTQGLIDTLLRPELHPFLGVADNADLRARGCVLAHDSRIMGPEFVEMAARVLLAHGVRVMVLGMATTPEVSTAIAETHAAFSINFTPSHNPFNYHGYKFNPSDGGPAPETLTRPVAARANAIFEEGGAFQALGLEALMAAKKDSSRYATLDPMALFKKSLDRRLPWLDLPGLIERINRADLHLFIDNGFGATQGKYEQLLEGVESHRLHLYNNHPDPLFGGANREPSVANFRQLQARMDACDASLVLGFMNDGDGDRFVGGGRDAVLVMNVFGPMVVRYLTRERGLSGDVTRSIMTSHMADAARARYLPEGRLNVTKVGFQYMRPFVAQSINSWEESDGMSPRGWSLDKDGLTAALLLTAMVLHYERAPEALVTQLEGELGQFFFQRTKVRGALAGEAMKAALDRRFAGMTAGDSLTIAARAFTVAEVSTLDGIKVIFDNGWWFGVRPSGTEPVVRPYVETMTLPEASSEAVASARDWHVRILDWLCQEVEAVIA